MLSSILIPMLLTSMRSESIVAKFIAMEFIDGQTVRELIHQQQTDLTKLLRHLQLLLSVAPLSLMLSDSAPVSAEAGTVKFQRRTLVARISNHKL